MGIPRQENMTLFAYFHPQGSPASLLKICYWRKERTRPSKYFCSYLVLLFDENKILRTLYSYASFGFILILVIFQDFWWCAETKPLGVAILSIENQTREIQEQVDSQRLTRDNLDCSIAIMTKANWQPLFVIVIHFLNCQDETDRLSLPFALSSLFIL